MGAMHGLSPLITKLESYIRALETTERELQAKKDRLAGARNLLAIGATDNSLNARADRPRHLYSLIRDKNAVVRVEQAKVDTVIQALDQRLSNVSRNLLKARLRLIQLTHNMYLELHRRH